VAVVEVATAGAEHGHVFHRSANGVWPTAAPAGCGKSALVTRAGQRLADTFPDGHIFMAATPLSRVADLLGRALRALGVPAADVPEQLDERVGRYRSLLASRRVLIVVDGAADVEQVRLLVPAHPVSALLVTSRNPLWALDGLPHVALRPLSPAVQRLRRKIRAAEEAVVLGGDEPLGPVRGGYELAGWRTGT
jgi:hypothetical protein